MNWSEDYGSPAMSLEGKVILVTGASRGIGFAIAERLGLEGARLGICARQAEALEQAGQRLQETGCEVMTYVCDVQNRDQVEQFVQVVAEQFGQIDGLVSNVGILEPTPLEPPADEVWDRIIRANLHGPYYLTTRVLPQMPDSGRLVFVASVLAKFGAPGSAAYCAAKHGLIGFVRAAALELAPRRITVNAVCPGWTDTVLAGQVMEQMAEARGQTYTEVRQDVEEGIPLGRILQPWEVADLVSFLFSPGAGNITGQAYNICGGQVMH